MRGGGGVAGGVVHLIDVHEPVVYMCAIHCTVCYSRPPLIATYIIIVNA